MTTVTEVGGTSLTNGRRLQHLAGIDGLRAVAVLAVLAFHLDVPWAQGGFLGVEVFFVVSGYLITNVLVDDTGSGLRISLRQFWMRRARRLLAALGLLLGGVTAYVAVVLPDELTRIRGDLAAALAYVSNWHLISGGGSYFEWVGRPSPLQHLWSLAIEEQFYVVWPLLLVVLLPRLGRRRAAVVCTVGALVSTAAMWMFAARGDIAHAYYGTDSRGSGLLAGAAVALLVRPASLRSRPRPTDQQPRRAVLDVAGAAALVGLVAIVMRTSEFDRSLYSGTFLRVDLLTCVVLLAVVSRASRLGRLLAIRPLRWIGLRSYSLYLWHWPVVVMTRPGLDLPWTGWRVTSLRLMLTFALGAVSYRWVEQPVRDGALGRAWRSLRVGAMARHDRRRWLLGGAVLVLLVFGLGSLTLRARHAPTDTELLIAAAGPPVTVATPPTRPSTTSTSTTTTTTSLVPVPTAPPVPEAIAFVAPSETVAVDPDPLPPPEPEPPPPVPVPPPPPSAGVLAIGDSVFVGASNALSDEYGGNIAIDARVSRQVKEGIEALRSWVGNGAPSRILIHLGTNGPFYPDQFDEIMSIAGPDRTVVFVTVHVPRSWEDQSNSTIYDGVTRYGNARLVDWRAMVDANPDYVGSDGIHCTAAGAAALASAAHQTTG